MICETHQEIIERLRSQLAATEVELSEYKEHAEMRLERIGQLRAALTSKEEELSAEKTRVLMLDAGWRETIRQLRASEALAQKYREALRIAHAAMRHTRSFVRLSDGEQLNKALARAEQTLKEGE